MTGNWLQITGRAYLVYDITGSKAALGVIYFLSYIPNLFLAPFAGVLADRFDRRRLMVLTQTLLAAGAFVMGALAHSETATVFNVGAVSFLMGIVQVLVSPVTQAVVPSLVPTEDLSSAITLSSASQSATRVLGPLLAGVLIPAVGVAWAFYGNAIAATLLVVLWARTHLPAQDVPPSEGPLTAIRAGVQFVRRTPRIRHPLVIVAFMSAVGLVYQPLTVALATDILAGGDSSRGAGYYGLLQAGVGVGSVLGILGFSGMGSRTPGKALLLTSAGFGLVLTLLGFASSTVTVLAAMVGIGAFHFASATLALDVLQHATPDVFRGRVMALYSMAWVGLFPFTSIAGGFLADAVGLRATLSGAGVLCAVFALLYVRLAAPSMLETVGATASPRHAT
jgi:MFS family permease